MRLKVVSTFKGSWNHDTPSTDGPISEWKDPAGGVISFECAGTQWSWKALVLGKKSSGQLTQDEGKAFDDGNTRRMTQIAKKLISN